MRPTAYRRNARGLRDRQAFEARPHAGRRAVCRRPLPSRGRPPARVWPGKTSAAGTPVGKRAGWRRCAAPAPPGTPRACRDAQRAAIDQALRQGARAHGFDTDHWTLARITTRDPAAHRGRLPSRPHLEAAAPPWAGGCSAPPAAPSSATSRPSPAGWPRTGPRIRRKRPPPARGDRVLGRVGRLAAAGDPPDLGAAGPHPGHPPPLQVEALFDGRRAVLRVPRWRRGARLPPPGRRLRHRQP